MRILFSVLLFCLLVGCDSGGHDLGGSWIEIGKYVEVELTTKESLQGQL